MELEELKEKHEYHKTYGEEWEVYSKIQEGGKVLIEYALTKYNLESDTNYDERVRDGVAFNVGKRIVEIFNFYLNEKETIYNIEVLKDNEFWKMFMRDSDLSGTDFKALMIEARKWASYYGSIGILVNKPYSPGRSRGIEIQNGIYPYCTLYSVQNIHDWKWKKNPETHRWELAMLKLYEGKDTWTIWTPDRWDQWCIEEGKKMDPVLLESGENPLGEVPFLWMLNIRNLKTPEIGISDLIDIASTVCSITRNVSAGDEIVKYAGFPIMRMPMKRADLGMALSTSNLDAETGNEKVPIGEKAVLEFDPSLGEGGKPDWMPTEILEPIEAILKWIDRKEQDVYAAAYLSGVRSQKISGSGEGQTSGLALRYELSQLKSVLTFKSASSIEAQYGIIRLWLKWLGESIAFDENNTIVQSQEFNIDEMAVALENAIESYSLVNSKTFRDRIQRKVAFSALPDLSQQEKEQIKTEIGKNTPESLDLTPKVTNRSLIKSASSASPGNNGEK